MANSVGLAIAESVLISDSLSGRRRQGARPRVQIMPETLHPGPGGLPLTLHFSEGLGSAGDLGAQLSGEALPEKALGDEGA